MDALTTFDLSTCWTNDANSFCNSIGGTGIDRLFIIC